MENIKYKDYEIKIENDDYPFNPFDDDAMGKIIFHPESGYKVSEGDYFEAKENNFSVMLEAYIHSGIALSVMGQGHQCQFDTSHGIAIWIPSDDCKPNNKNEAVKWADQACSLFNQWENGEVYHYSIDDEDGELIDSCGGFFGYDHEESGLLINAREAIDYHVKEVNKKKISLKKGAKQFHAMA